MDKTFTNQQITYIRDQALVYQCACPAQVCVAIDSIRQLHTEQQRCLDATDMDHAVHERIKSAAELVHAELEQCLTDVLRIEGWDRETLEMPKDLQKRFLENK